MSRRLPVTGMRLSRRAFTHLLALGAPTLGSACAARSVTGPNFVPLIARVSASVVAIGSSNQTVGSGFVVRPNLLITAAHVAQAASNGLVITSQSGKQAARIVAMREEDDLAILEVSQALPPLRLAAQLPRVGEWIVSSASIGDIVSGASLSFHISKRGGSQIEGYGFDTTWAGGNETWFIGTEAFSLVRDLISSFDPSEVESVQDVWDFFEGMADAVNASFEGYENAHTQGDDLYQGGCILDDSSSCTALIFNEGFPDVTTGRFPSPVIIILHNTNNGSWSSGMYNFIP